MPIWSGRGRSRGAASPDGHDAAGDRGTPGALSELGAILADVGSPPPGSHREQFITAVLIPEAASQRRSGIPRGRRILCHRGLLHGTLATGHAFGDPAAALIAHISAEIWDQHHKLAASRPRLGQQLIRWAVAAVWVSSVISQYVVVHLSALEGGHGGRACGCTA